MEGGVQNYIDPMGISDSAVTFHKCLLMARMYLWNSQQNSKDQEDECNDDRYVVKLHSFHLDPRALDLDLNVQLEVSSNREPHCKYFTLFSGIKRKANDSY